MVTVEGFWARVDRSGGDAACWVWQGPKDNDGYGIISKANPFKEIRSHRLAWCFERGPVPAGLCVLHNCPAGDNPACCNPAHLWLGTNRDNQLDKVAKGRQARGDTHGARTHLGNHRGVRNGSAKLDDAKVMHIRATYAAGGVSFKMLARKYGMTDRAIAKLVHRVTWRHV